MADFIVILASLGFSAFLTVGGGILVLLTCAFSGFDKEGGILLIVWGILNIVWYWCIPITSSIEVIH